MFEGSEFKKTICRHDEPPRWRRKHGSGSTSVSHPASLESNYRVPGSKSLRSYDEVVISLYSIKAATVAPSGPPTCRFDAPGREYRVLYVGQTLSAAFVETLLRNPRIPFVERTEIELRSASVLTNDHALTLAAGHEPIRNIRNALLISKDKLLHLVGK